MEWFGFERFNRRITDDAPYQWTSLVFQRPAGAHAEIQRKPGSLRSPEAGPDWVGAGRGRGALTGREGSGLRLGGGG